MLTHTHTQSVFNCDYASISFSSCQNRSRFFFTGEESKSDLPHATLNTICDHATLLNDDEVFVIPDLIEDWRFNDPTFCAKRDHLRFYASAPILLAEGASTASSEKQKGVQVGRLTIMRKEAWKSFGENEAEVLMDIAKMASEAIENEYLHIHAKKVQRMQRELAFMSYHLNLAVDEDITQDKAKESTMGVLLCPPQMQRVVDLIRETVSASTVTAIDITDYRLQGPRSESTLFSATSPRGSVQYGAYPSMPWLRNVSSEEASQDSEYEFRSSTSGSDINGSLATSPTEMTSPPSSTSRQRRLFHNRTASSGFSLEDTERYQAAVGSHPRVVVSSGDADHYPIIDTPVQIQEMGDLLTKIRKDHKLTKPHLFENRTDQSNSSDEDENVEDEIENPLLSLLSPSTTSYITIPVFANDRIQPLFMIVVTFTSKKSLPESERLFLYSCGVIVGAACLRQQARLADRAQLDFIRSVQHELRTPLNGILGITDFLRQSLVSGDITEKLDLTEDGLLASLLESIRLSGVNLSTILDDVLDFGAVSGVRGNDFATTRIEEVDLVREIEDGCLDDLEHIAMHERQDQRLMVYRGYSAVPTLVIKVAPELQTRFRTDRTKLKKILSKFVANALRYSDESQLVEVTALPSQLPAHNLKWRNESGDQWVDFIIEDTGIGMSQDFLKNSLLKPFSKADSFSQGVGLGVTIAASLISQMQGKLHIQSELGKGTRVQVTLPLGQRPTLVSKSSNFTQIYRPYQVKTACFYGFILKGQKKIVEMIQERLIQNGIRIVESDREAELVIIKETALPPKTEDEEGQVVFSKPEGDLPRPIGPKGRVLVVSRSALRGRNVSFLEGIPVWLFRPPFGPSSLDLMDEFLREESPLVLNSVPTAATENNMKKVKSHLPTMDQDDNGSADRKSDVKISSPPVLNASTDSPFTKKLPLIEGTRVFGRKEDMTSPPLISNTPPTDSTPVIDLETSKPFRVLVVEDNYVNMRLITAVLKRGGYSFVEAKDGIEAVEQYKAFRPSIVLLDISLPLQDGFEACLQMRAHDMGHIPKIIAITALSSNEDKIKGLEVCGMDDWRTKPLNIKTLRTDLVVWQKEWNQVWTVEKELPPPTTTATSVSAIAVA